MIGARVCGTRAATALCLAMLLSGCRTPAPRTAPQHLPPAGRQQLQRDLNTILNAPTLEHGYWGVLVKSLKNGETLYAVNPRKLMVPASNLKIVTLAAAADRLGWDFTYETTLLAAGTIADGVLTGDLLVVGSGDPSLTEAMAPAIFADWAARLKSAGITAVTGRLVGDDNAFDDDGLGMGWSWDDLPEAYAAGVGALQFNENMARITVAAGPTVGAPASVAIDPEAAGLTIRNHLTTGDPQSAGLVQLRRSPGGTELEVRGSLPLGNPPALRLVSVDNPTMFFASALRKGLVDNGVDVHGPAVDIDAIADAPAQDHATTVVSYRSAPLSTLALRLMKNSVNQYGETMLKALGVASGTPTADGGITTAAAILKTWGLADGALIQRDGSGLSRYNFTSAEAFVAILEHVDHDEKLKGPFEASLPIAGVDGSLANRMKGTRAEGNAKAKTGSMTSVRTISGYVTTADGEPLVFSILANNYETPSDVVNTASDAVIVRLAQFRR